MPLADWRDDYCTGDVRIDQEHQALFVMVNHLDHAITTAASQSQLQTILSTLATHTIEHFQHEEALMQALSYPGYRRHKQVHDNLLAKVSALLDHVKQPDAALADDLTAFLAEWLAHHIKGEDQTMIHFLQNRVNAGADAQS
jgi:hemerythrin